MVVIADRIERLRRGTIEDRVKAGVWAKLQCDGWHVTELITDQGHGVVLDLQAEKLKHKTMLIECKGNVGMSGIIQGAARAEFVVTTSGMDYVGVLAAPEAQIQRAKQHPNYFTTKCPHVQLMGVHIKGDTSQDRLGPRWSEGDLELLHELAKRGFSRQQAARACERTVIGLTAKASRERISFDKSVVYWTPTQQKLVMELFPTNASVSSISHKTGKSGHAIFEWASEHGLSRPKRKWVKEDIQYLQTAYYNTPQSQITKRLGRAWKKILPMAHRLGLKRQKWRVWSPTETKELIDAYKSNKPIKNICKRFGITTSAMMTKLSALGVKPRKCVRWTTLDDQQLKKLYPTTISLSEIAKKLGRSRESISTHAYLFGLRRPTHFWSGLEKNELKTMVKQKMSDQQISRALGRPIYGICAKKQKLGLNTNRQWKQWQLDLLKEQFPNRNIPLYRISERTGKTMNAINGMANRLGLVGERANDFSDKEERLLKKYYPDYKKSSLEIQKLMPTHSLCSIKTKAVNLGLKRGHLSLWLEEDVQTLKKYYEKKIPLSELCHRLGNKFTRPQIHGKANALGLGRRPKIAGLTLKEKSQLRRMVKKKIPVNIIASHLKKKINVIYDSGYNMGLSFGYKNEWSEKEIIELERLHSEGTSIEEITHHMKRSIGSIKEKLVELDLVWTRGKDWFTPKEVEALRRVYPTGTREMVTTATKHGWPVIERKARELGLVKQPNPHYWDEPLTRKAFLALRGGKSIAEVAKEIGRPDFSIRQRVKTLGLSMKMFPYKRDS